jgi:sugar lactone lactonase YvrE
MKKLLLYTALAAATTTSHAQPKLEQVFSDNTYQFTGVAVSAAGRLFVTYPRWEGPYQYAVMEVGKDGKARPFPDAAMNQWTPGEDGREKWVCVQTAYVDDHDFLYIVDPAAPGLEKVVDGAAKVVKFNLQTNRIEKAYRFPSTLDNHSYLNDIRVDTKKQVAYLTNSGTGGIVILDLVSGNSRQVLQNHRSVHPDPYAKFIIDGKELKKQGYPVAFQSDGIALTPDRAYLYYKTITDKKLNRIKTAALLDTALSGQQLAAAVEELGDVAHTDGMVFDGKGNLYMGDPTTYELLYVTPDHKPHSWIKSAELVWPDTYSVSKDGYLYVSTSQIHKQPAYNEGVNKRTSPYKIFKVKL